jgi:ATP phosphoribosyltransferase regulatory subunit
MAEGDGAALLPAGLRDVLPPHAAHAADLVHALRLHFAGYGYEWVEPPLIEFEESLLSGAGSAIAKDTFRLMDPVSQRMMGIRGDITVQVARIATTRLAHLPRPLRLAYAGDVLRVRGTQLRPERQFTQIGAELIGTEDPAADVEAVTMAVDALHALGIDRISVDLTLPTLVPAVLGACGIPEERASALREALDHKDAAAVDAIGATLGDAGGPLNALLAAGGPAAAAFQQLSRARLPPEARREADRLCLVGRQLTEALPAVAFTVDAVENRGLEYHNGVCFTIFRAGVRGELGLGGRYRAGPAGNPRPLEPATGFTLYLGPLLRAVPERSAERRTYLPHGTPAAVARKLRAQGERVLMGLAPEPGTDVAAEARRLGCTALLRDGKVVEL